MTKHHQENGRVLPPPLANTRPIRRPQPSTCSDVPSPGGATSIRLRPRKGKWLTCSGDGFAGLQRGHVCGSPRLSFSSIAQVWSASWRRPPRVGTVGQGTVAIWTPKFGLKHGVQFMYRWHRTIKVSVSVQPHNSGCISKPKRYVVIHDRLRAVRGRLIEVYPYNLKDFAKLRESKPVCPFTAPQASLLG